MRKFGWALALLMSAVALWVALSTTNRSTGLTSGRVLDERGIYTSEGLSDDLEVLGYEGGKTTVSLAHVKPKPGERLWYLFGHDILKGTGPQATMLEEASLRLEEIAEAGGSFGEMPSAIQQTVIYQRERGVTGEATIRGRAQLKEIYKNGRGLSHENFNVPIPANAAGRAGGFTIWPDLSLETLRKGVRLVLREESFIPYDERGQEDPSNATTIRWHVSLKLIPVQAEQQSKVAGLAWLARQERFLGIGLIRGSGVHF